MCSSVPKRDGFERWNESSAALARSAITAVDAILAKSLYRYLTCRRSKTFQPTN